VAAATAIPIEDLARLARIALTEEERARYGAELGRVIEMMAQLAEADVDGVEPLAHPFDAVLRLRPDKVTESDRSEEFLAQAPATQGGFFLVPRVLE
jgi:aspartyl-tRNA(Asn)/glutamyl-tRNA(Gln) amidotransferase subunit C